jgi:trimethylamine:corrinoid methyltransferase-like protein
MPLQTWLKEGKSMYRDEAFKVAKKMIEEVDIPELPRDIDRELVKVVREAEKRETARGGTK